jgi:hypothetical protein
MATSTMHGAIIVAVATGTMAGTTTEIGTITAETGTTAGTMADIMAGTKSGTTDGGTITKPHSSEN